jgi:L,D-transpeptidase YcbB
MGRMKFMFPNDAGVYLHDNPERELFTEASRLYSGGCVRLEDAARLGRWLFGYDLDWESAGTEQRVPLPALVPVYITYLTAIPEGSSIAFYDDVYGRDAARLAATSSNVTGTLSASGNR